VSCATTPSDFFACMGAGKHGLGVLVAMHTGGDAAC